MPEDEEGGGAEALEEPAMLVLGDEAAPSVPQCAMCEDPLLMWGGPVSLVCGHSLCLDCLQKAQAYNSVSTVCPLCKEMEEWVPVSVPPMELADLAKGLYENGGRGVFAGLKVSPEKKLGALFLAMKKVVAEHRRNHATRKQSLYTSDLLDEEDVRRMKAVFEAEPPEWLPDSSAAACMRCGTSFRALTCGRHHCRFCGGIYCAACSSSRSLLPSKFRIREPQRVCTTCADKLEPGQRLIAFQVSRAFQVATQDVTDASCLRSWLNSPLGISLEHEIYKATNTIRHFHKAGLSSPEMSIPTSVLSKARGLAILTVLKAGCMVTYNVGTGLVVARGRDGSWSAPSAIASCGMGVGAQVGGELTDFIIVLRTEDAVKAFSGSVHLSLGAGLSLAAGPVGRHVEADLRTGDGGMAACFTYSCCKGAFVGCSLEGNVVVTRSSTNCTFYGDSCLATPDILFGSVPQPRAAGPLYSALEELVRGCT